MRSLSADAALQHGLNPYANIIDELHAHRTADLYTALTTGTGAREQPFTLWISTAGVDGPGILSELHASMFDGPGELEERGSLLGLPGPHERRPHLVVRRGPGRRHRGPAVWLRANPASWLRDGRYLAQEYARLKSRGALLEWRRYHLNQFVGTEEAWLLPMAPGRPAASATPIPTTRSTASTRPPSGRRHRQGPDERPVGDRRRPAPGGPGRGEVACSRPIPPPAA